MDANHVMDTVYVLVGMCCTHAMDVKHVANAMGVMNVVPLTQGSCGYHACHGCYACRECHACDFTIGANGIIRIHDIHNTCGLWANRDIHYTLGRCDIHDII